MSPDATTETQLLSNPCKNEAKSINSRTSEITKDLFGSDVDGKLASSISSVSKPQKHKIQLVWRNVILFFLLHVSAVYGGWLLLTSAKWETFFFVCLLSGLSCLGITAGAHRLWAHRSYKAKWQNRLMLMIFNTLAFEDAVYDWARDHRVHHKYSDTDADPYNARRGFFFAHIGWLLCKKHPDVKTKGKNVDLSDLQNDRILMFQKKHYLILMPLICFIIPTIIPMFAWNESFLNSWFVATMFRWCYVLNATWLVNSAAHIYGYRPYEKSIHPRENLVVSILTYGEGWHNYHHVFPWDYKASEWPASAINATTLFIDLMAKIGWAYDRKTVSQEVIEKRVKRTGDGTHTTWGWGDKDITKEEQEAVLITDRRK